MKPSDLLKWKAKYRALKKFYKSNQHCRVPYRYEEDPALGRWVQRQRINKVKLTVNQIELLNKLSFSWSNEIRKEKDKNFVLMFRQLVRYQKKYGITNVPCKDSDHYTLSRWVEHQRILEKKGTLPDWKKTMLLSISFTFSKELQTQKRQHWYVMLDRLLEFKKLHGHCNVPEGYKKDKDLWIWVAIQRRPKKPLSVSQNRLLTELGFDFRPGLISNKMRDEKGRFKSLL